MITKEQAKKLADKVLSYSTFPECDISINTSEHASIRFALNGITTSGFAVSQRLRYAASSRQTGCSPSRTRSRASGSWRCAAWARGPRMAR